MNLPRNLGEFQSVRACVIINCIDDETVNVIYNVTSEQKWRNSIRAYGETVLLSVLVSIFL